jgi:hypothetical protein
MPISDPVGPKKEGGFIHESATAVKLGRIKTKAQRGSGGGRYEKRSGEVASRNPGGRPIRHEDGAAASTVVVMTLRVSSRKSGTYVGVMIIPMMLLKGPI